MLRLIDRLFNRLNRHSPILFQTPWPRNIGNCAEEMRYGILKAQRDGKRTLFVFHRHELFGRLRVPIANRELFLLESECLYPAESVVGFVAGWVLTAILAIIRPCVLAWRSEKVRKPIRRIFPWAHLRSFVVDAGPSTIPAIGTSRLWQTDGARTFQWRVVDDLQWREQYARYSPPRLAETKRQAAQRLRTAMGIPSEDWFVALHVREGTDHFGSRSVNYRNSSIANYFDALRAITDAGGWVVRLGDPSMSRLPVMERVIDYAHSPWKSELMDLYLISECRFYLGTTSGPYDVAVFLGRPVLTTNATEWSYWGPMGAGDRGILKHVFSRQRGRVLSLSELVNEPFECQCASTLGDTYDYQLIENSADEIRAAVDEFMRASKDQPSELQRLFNEARSHAVRRWLDEGYPHGFADRESHVTEQYRLASRAESAAGALSQSFLDENWDSVPRWLKDLSDGSGQPAGASGSGYAPQRTKEYVELEG